MNDPVEAKHVHWMGCFIIAVGKNKQTKKTAWESDPLAGPLCLTIQYIEEEKTKVNLPCWHFPCIGCIHQFLKETAIKLLTTHGLPKKPGRSGRGSDGVGTGWPKHSYITAVWNQWVLKPMSSCQLDSSLNRLELTCSGKKKKSGVCFFWGQKDVNAGVWQWERGRKRGW